MLNIWSNWSTDSITVSLRRVIPDTGLMVRVIDKVLSLEDMSNLSQELLALKRSDVHIRIEDNISGVSAVLSDKTFTIRNLTRIA